jgi:hypothetical protein
MRCFIDTHDRSKNSFPPEEVTLEQFLEIYAGMDAALIAEGGFAVDAHVNLPDAKAFCRTRANDEAAVAAAHEKIGLPYDSITVVQRVSSIDLR